MVAVISSEGHGVNAWDTRSLASECLRQKDLADNGRRRGPNSLQLSTDIDAAIATTK